MPEIPSHNSNRYVSWTVFASIVGLLVIGIGWAMATSNNAVTQVDRYYQQLLEIKAQLSQIQTDIRWIKLQLQQN